MAWLAPTSLSSGGRSAVSASSGTREWYASISAAWSSAAAVPEVQRRATGRSVAFAIPSPKKDAERSSTWTQTWICGWRAKAMASGAEREPGARHTWRSPARASSSTKVSANACVTFGSAMEVVTCLHGFSQRGESWRELASLVPGELPWLMPDLGATALDAAIAEILELWRREGVERSPLLGYSAGGRLALGVAVRHPERLLTLTLIGAHAGFEGAARRARLKADEALAERIERDG